MDSRNSFCLFQGTACGGAAYRRLKTLDPQGSFKWHEQDLKRLHQTGSLPEIGVPQGGALSCLVANAVLHTADKALSRLAATFTKPFTYLRYCDDMIILAADKAVCHAAFRQYRGVLRRLRLPAHDPHRVGKYSPEFWTAKSNYPYQWCGPSKRGGIPWIQFVGYQIRYDGLVRVRPKSLRKHRGVLTEITDRLLLLLKRSKRNGTIRRTAREIEHRFRQRLISMGVGRITLGKVCHGPRPMCWAAGFRGLCGQSIVRTGLKALDRHRERQIKRVTRKLETLALPSAGRCKSVRALKYYGRPFSYWHQF